MFKTTANSNAGGDFEKCPTGSMAGRLAAIIDLGHQWQDGYQGDKGYFAHRLYFVWQTSKKNSTGDYHYIGKDLTFSLAKNAKLRAWVQSRLGRTIADGEEFDLADELGQPCLLSVKASNKGYPVLESITQIPEEMTAPDLARPPLGLSLEQINKGERIPDWVPWLYGKAIGDWIANCQENGGRAGGNGEYAAPPSNRNTEAGTDAGAKDGPPPRPKPANQGNGHATADHHHATFWMTDREGHDRRFTGQQVCQEMANCDLDPDQTLVCIEGGAEWKPASFYGLQPGIPF